MFTKYMQVELSKVSSSAPEYGSASLTGSGGGHKWNLVIWALLLTGILLRLFHFLDNRSFWIDEVYLSSSLISMDFMELASPPLLYEQKAPVGYLWLAKLAVMLFGTGDMALRLVPLVSGVASLFVFLPVARYFLKPVGVVVAIGIMALAPPLVYHAVEAKQYATELLATAVILWLYTRYHRQLAFRQLAAWGVWGAVIIWFSYSSIFVLAGMAFGICLFYLIRKDWQALFRSLLPFTMWLVSFVINFFLFTYKHANSEWLVYFFGKFEAFMPFPPRSWSDLKWFVWEAASLQRYPLGLAWTDFTEIADRGLRVFINLSLFSSLIMGIGVFAFFRQDKKALMVLLFPILLVLLASGLELYPFYDRLILFLAPLLALFVARGCEKTISFFPSGARWAYLLPVLLLAAPFAASVKQVIHTDDFGGFKKSSYREALLYINDQVEEGDVVYVYWNFMYAYRYYDQTLPLQFDAIEGRDVKASARNTDDYISKLAPDLEAISQYKRVWVIRDNNKSLAIGDLLGQPEWYYVDSVRSGSLVERRISGMGEVVEAFRMNNVNVTLVDLPGR